MAEAMRVAIKLGSKVDDAQLRFARQIGCEGVVLQRPGRLPGVERWEYDDLARLRDWVQNHGLRIEALEDTPHEFWDRVRLGLPGREVQLESYLQTIRNIGQAGIPVLAYNFRPDPLYRTGTQAGRGGAIVTTFDRALVDDSKLTYGQEYSAEHMWEAYTYFIRAAIPVAEQAGIALALHPDGPPGPTIGGVARIFSSFEGFERGSRIIESPAWTLLYCVGCWAEMGGMETVMHGIQHFGTRGKISFVHFRDVVGIGDQFSECFIGEGALDLAAVMRELGNVGFTGCLIDDHAPRMEGDDDWAPRAHAYQTGYLQGVLRAVRV